MNAGASPSATLISASCSAQAGYSSALRPAQIGSPMTRTRVPGWSATNWRSTPPMMRPGLRPATDMSAVRTTASSSAVSAERSRSRLGWGTATSTGSPRARPSRMNGMRPARYVSASE